MPAEPAISDRPRPVRVDFRAFLEQLRDRLTLSEIVGRKVALKRKGREHAGLCPFHNEKTPSFWVNDAKAFFHCFGCGAHGDAIEFVMRAQGLDFMEAVSSLAQDVGLTVPSATAKDRERAERVASLHQVTAAADRFFQQQLAAPVGKAALDYLRGRSLDAAAIERFGLGYAPDHREALRASLKREGIAEAQLIEAGLVAVPGDEGRTPYERFRGRVMFPIHDRRGRVIAFGGRVLDDGTPKYVNSPETPLFDKGATLYALHLAREAAAAGRPVIVVEGYLDVIALHQAGLDGAVAPLGTALTETQLGLLWRLADEPYLCFDGDGAGQRAAARVVERALPMLQPGKSLRFVALPEGEDPDSLVRKGGAAAIEAALAAAVPMVDMLWRAAFVDGEDATPERRAGIRKDLLERVNAIAEPGVREHYRAAIETRLRKAWGRFKPTVIPGGREGTRDADVGTDGAPSASNAQGRRGGGDGDGRADRMAMELLEEIELWHDERGEAFATFEIGGHRENWPVRSDRFASWLRWRAQQRAESLLGAAEVEKVIGALAARAVYEGPEFETFTRMGAFDGRIYVDLGDADWRCVEIRPVPLDRDEPKWQILARAPVKFLRRPSMRPMAEPVAGGSIDDLRAVLNVASEGDFRMVIGWLLACYRVDGPFPLLLISGPPGAGKSIMLRVLARLVDPTHAPERNLPRDERDLYVSATAGHLSTFDNLSGINASMADALCRIATGGGFSARKLHSDDSEHIMSATKPILINGIGDLARRGDLADRALLVTAARLGTDTRRPEEDFWRDFAEIEPGILGALFDVIGYALTTYAETRVPPVRMADAARFMEAGAGFLGWEEGTFARILRANRQAAIEAVVDSDLFAIELLRLLTESPAWRGNTAELLDELNQRAPDKVRRSTSWPANPSAAKSALDRLKDVLEAKGYIYERGKTNGERWLQFAQLAAMGEGER